MTSLVSKFQSDFCEKVAMAERAEYEEDRSRVDVTHVSVPNAWRLGAMRAAEILFETREGESPLYDAVAAGRSC